MLAKTKHVNIRVAENDYQKIKQFADFNGKSISALLLDNVLEQIETLEDQRDIKEYETNKNNGTLITHSWVTVKKGIKA
jgi:uncharacterized protein (DUF1778 family)